jgi:hypothetical protein
VRCGEQRTQELVKGLKRLCEWWLKSKEPVEEVLVVGVAVDGASDVRDDGGVMAAAVKDGMVANVKSEKERMR